MSQQNILTFGPAYDPTRDGPRIKNQHKVIREYMHAQGKFDVWLTLGEIEKHLGFPQASISAQLRHLRKPAFGGFDVLKRRRGSQWEYTVREPVKTCEQLSLFA